MDTAIWTCEAYCNLISKLIIIWHEMMDNIIHSLFFRKKNKSPKNKVVLDFWYVNEHTLLVNEIDEKKNFNHSNCDDKQKADELNVCNSGECVQGKCISFRRRCSDVVEC